MAEYFDRLKELSVTPALAWINSGMLFATPFLSPAAETPMSLTARRSAGFLTALARPRFIGPTTKTTILFGLTQALGGWIMHEGDLESGTGFLAAWSTLYMLVGGRGSFTALRFGRVWPLILTTANGISALLYGQRFVTGHFN